MTYFDTHGAFQCFQDSAVTYRTNLHAPNRSVDFVKQVSLWLSTGPSVLVMGVPLNLDSTCNLIISSFDDPECVEVTEQETTHTISISDKLHIILGASIGSVAMILIVLICCCAAVVWHKKLKDKRCT